MTRFAPLLLNDRFVTLRPWRDADADTLVQRINDPEVARFLDQVPQPYRLTHAHEYLQSCREGWRTGSTTNLALFVDGVEGPAGSMGIRWDDRGEGAAGVGYWVAAEARGTAPRPRAWADPPVGVRSGARSVPAAAASRVENGASNRVAEKGRLHPRRRAPLVPLQRAERQARRLRRLVAPARGGVSAGANDGGCRSTGRSTAS